MIDFRPIAHVCGNLVALLGLTMLPAMLLDYLDQDPNWSAFALSMIFCLFIGSMVAMASKNRAKDRLTLQQTFLMTTSVWLVLPLFGSLPFVLGETDARAVDAFFEAMSGLTTTGATVFTGLEELPRGLLLWRGILQWLGGVGIIVVAMVFLPLLRVGGMQIFKSEGFDTFGKVLPRAREISRNISNIYITLTFTCFLAYLIAGVQPFDALTHSLTTIATGGFANYDASFAALGAGAQYVAMVFMLLAALPFVRYVQLLGGTARPLLFDPQVRMFFLIVGIVVAILTLWQLIALREAAEPSLRLAAFNGISILTGTGFASDNYMAWGAFPVALMLFIGLIGGCAGSTSCSIKVFRFQLLFTSIATQIRRLQNPNGIFKPRYSGMPVTEDVISSVTAFFMFFLASIAVITVALGMTGLDMITSISGSIAALANIGPGLGPQIGPAGNYSAINDTAKWILSFAMLLGRLELLAVFVLFTPGFWRG